MLVQFENIKNIVMVKPEITVILKIAAIICMSFLLLDNVTKSSTHLTLEMRVTERFGACTSLGEC